MIGPNTVIGFGGDGHPDTDWLGSHERTARERGETLRADALAWLVTAFDRHVVLVPRPDFIPDPDFGPFAGVDAEVGGYRLFEFTAAMEELRASRLASRQQVAAIRGGQRDWGLTYEAAAKEEIHACMGNFMCVPGYAGELEAADWRTRWVDTVPAELSGDIAAFAASYLGTMRSLDAVLPPHDDALRLYTRALGEAYGCPSADFASISGRAHARRTVLFAIGAARTVRRLVGDGTELNADGPLSPNTSIL